MLAKNLILGISTSLTLVSIGITKPTYALLFSETIPESEFISQCGGSFTTCNPPLHFNLNFSNLPTPLPGGGTLIFEIQTDLAASTENFDINLDPPKTNLFLGVFANNNTSDDRGNSTDDIGTDFFQTFTSAVILTDEELNTLLLDGSLVISTTASPSVGPYNNPNSFTATLKYNEATAVPFKFSPTLTLIIIGCIWSMTHFYKSLTNF